MKLKTRRNTRYFLDIYYIDIFLAFYFIRDEIYKADLRDHRSLEFFNVRYPFSRWDIFFYLELFRIYFNLSCREFIRVKRAIWFAKQVNVILSTILKYQISKYERYHFLIILPFRIKWQFTCIDLYIVCETYWNK